MMPLLKESPSQARGCMQEAAEEKGKYESDHKSAQETTRSSA